METITCPHCNGTGTVSEDFLTDDLVIDVFYEWCKVFGYSPCTIMRFVDCGFVVEVFTFDEEDAYSIPREFFIRDAEVRIKLMQRAKTDADERYKLDRIKQAERDLHWAEQAVEARKRALELALGNSPTT